MITTHGNVRRAHEVPGCSSRRTRGSPAQPVEQVASALRFSAVFLPAHGVSPPDLDRRR